MNTWASLMQHGGHIQLNKSWLNLLQKKFLPLTSRRFRRTFKLIFKAEVAINELLSDLNFNWD